MRHVQLSLTVICAMLVLSLLSCRDEHSGSDDPLPQPSFTVADAKRIYEAVVASSTRNGMDDPSLPALGAIEPDWGRGAPSRNDYAASVDVPLTARYTYQVRHSLPDGTSLWLFLYPKLVILEGIRINASDLYIAFYIPDPTPEQTHSEDVGAHYRNSLPKTGFSGRILYTTLEGVPIAAACYADGFLVATAFLWDFQTTDEYLDALYETIDEIVLRRTNTETTRGIHDINPIPEVVVFARVNTGWNQILDMIHMKTEDFDHVNPSTDSRVGGGGSGSASPGKGSDAGPVGSEVSPHIETDDPEVMKLLEELDKDCMGSAFIDAIGYDLSVVTHTGNNRFGHFGTYTDGILTSEYGQIELSKMEDYVFLEELMHAYQHQGVSSEEFRQNQLNYEIEAKMAWLLYLQRTQGPNFNIQNYRGALGADKGANAFETMLICFMGGLDPEDLLFQDAYQDAVDNLAKIGSYGSADESSENRNFDNLSKLMENC